MMNHKLEILSLLVALAFVPASGQFAPLEAQEPISAEIVKMLEAELSEEVILEWLEDQVPTQSLSADDLVALKKAGASSGMLSALLEWSRDQPAPAATMEAPVPAGRVPSPERPTSSPSTKEASPAGSPQTSASAALVQFKLAYLARIEPPDPEWDLFVYIDGYPISYVTTASLENKPQTLEFEVWVPAGEHTLRVFQERHYRKGGRWEHESRVGEAAFPFSLAAGIPARIEVEFHEGMMRMTDPLSFMASQGGDVVDVREVGGDAQLWPLLCDDIQASVPEGKAPGREKRARLEECVDWEGLWNDDSPSRAEVLEAMAAFDFRPVPKGS